MLKNWVKGLMYIDKTLINISCCWKWVPKFFKAPTPCALHILETFVIRINFQLYKYVCWKEGNKGLYMFHILLFFLFLLPLNSIPSNWISSFAKELGRSNATLELNFWIIHEFDSE
jgi:hypothetical protein